MNTSSISRITSRRPVTADSGKPLARPLPKVARSGVTSNKAWAPPLAKRKPVMVSSNTSNAPSRWASARTAAR